MTKPTGKLITTSSQYKLKSLAGFIPSFLIVMIFLWNLVFPDPFGHTPSNLFEHVFSGFLYLMVLIAIGGVIVYTFQLLQPAKQFEVYKDGFILRYEGSKNIIYAFLWSEVTDIRWSLPLRN